MSYFQDDYDYFSSLKGHLDSIRVRCDTIIDISDGLIDGPLPGCEVPYVINEAEDIIKTAQNIITLAKKRERHPEVK